MFVENFQILLGEKTHVGGILFLWVNRRVDLLIRATRVVVVSFVAGLGQKSSVLCILLGPNCL